MTTPTQQARHARAAVAALFLTNGAVFFNVVPRFPQIRDDLHLSNVALGTAIAAMPVGALLAGLFAAPLIRRYQSARLAAFGVALTTVTALAIAFVPNGFGLAAALFLFGTVDAVIDVAQNTHGLRVQRLYGRSIVNSLHGVWSIGAVLGGLMGSTAAGLNLPLTLHLTISAVIFSAVALTAYRFLLPGPDESPTSPTTKTDQKPIKSAAVRLLAALGILAACGALVEDAGASWGAIFLTDELHTDAATAGLAVVAMQAAMTIGRLTGDRAVDHFGQRTVVRTGATLTALGMAAALAYPTVATALAGFALAGLGVATLVPAAMHTADEIPGLSPGTGLTVVSWLLRAGFLISPPLVGFLADQSSLRIGLLTVVAAGLITVVLARVLVNRPSST
ncbi:MFS transporter [Actinoplanes derwentensis]|uniref:Predicted arabinose efflux permease, MFS family n=1 Tax=Actinoplanes derwentensis TaxID=113562 RepID=A0A1H1W6U6_9ACTN|nr:MFS transporter [Actinoplanes derwentensis]GID84075.1 MFS transporter [Actinoplanes derwentensis]SDS92887.1 Predicted arabinose efflux permease, MFS family [Actinoplanes derwentensis]